MEKLVVEIDKTLFSNLMEFFPVPLIVNEDYTIKEVKVIDNFFDNDPTYQTLKSESNQAYKKLKLYEYNQRNK